jgi:hypothetical protein
MLNEERRREILELFAERSPDNCFEAIMILQL